MEKVWEHHKIAYGGDYNPEQWPKEIWKEDMRLLKLAHVDTVTLNVFSWAKLQPKEETYDFSQLDEIMDMVEENGLKVVLATSTAAHPAWMARKYPEILRVDAQGLKRKFGGRHNSCPNSPIYQKYATQLASELAKRYGRRKNLMAWHISNEYGGECYCENCEKAFREWLKEKYHTLDEVNRVWNTSFWGHTFYDWDEIVLPNLLSEHFCGERTMFQGISLDYRRFNSDSMLKCFEMEYDAVKAITPKIPVTTNLMGFYKPLDYQKWARSMDFVSWDSYPSNEDTIAQMALNHDLHRGLKQGAPFVLMEQTPSVTNWQPYNALKRPGVMRLWSYQAVAHGSDSVMFFQMRRSIGACEKYHGALIDHAGHENTRVFREAQALGAELEKLQDQLLGAREDAKVAIVFDWDNWWASEYSAGPSCLLKYHDEIMNYYSALHAKNIATDIVSVEDDLSKYKIVIAPLLYMTKEGYDEKIRTYVREGGCFVTTFFSGYVDEHDLVILGGYPGRLRDILGIWVEESDALPEQKENEISYGEKRYPATLLCDLLHTKGAEVLAEYEKDFYAKMPAVTRNQYGNGKAYYVATRSNAAFYEEFLGALCKEQGVSPMLVTPKGVEAVLRENEKGQFLFLLNHAKTEQTVDLDTVYTDLLADNEQKGQISIPAKDVRILRRK